jgi:hypothetical protein
MAVKTGKVTREGGLGINTNQPVLVPDFLSKKNKSGARRLYIQNFEINPSTGKRQLLGLSELDVSRDVVDLSFVTETDQESNPIGYFLDMEKWDESGLGIRINYTDPLQVGKGNDQIMTTLKNPDLFVSAASGKPVPQKSATSVKFSPPQVPKGVSEDRLLKDATNTNNAMLGMIIIQL